MNLRLKMPQSHWVGLFLLLLALSACSDHQEANPNEEDLNALLPEDLVYSHLPTDLTKVFQFVPIGSLQGLPKAHGGFMMKTFHKDATIPVYAMTDGIIYNIIFEKRTASVPFAPPEFDGYEYDDYALNIAVSRHADMWFGHVSRLDDTILQAAGPINFGRGVENKVRIEITAGQVIGYIGPHPGFDIGMYDFSRENYFANPDRHSEFYRHAQAWTDYLTPALREQVWQYNPRTVEPRGGKISYDVANTIAGNWFLEGTTSYLEWSKQLIIGRHEIHADQVAILDASPLLDGDGIQNADRQPYLWFIIGNAPLPEEITVSTGMIKYEVAPFWQVLANPNTAPAGTVAIQLTDDETLQYEWFEGTSAGEITGFSVSARIYKR